MSASAFPCPWELLVAGLLPAPVSAASLRSLGTAARAAWPGSCPATSFPESQYFMAWPVQKHSYTHSSLYMIYLYCINTQTHAFLSWLCRKMSISFWFDNCKERGVLRVRSRSLLCSGPKWCSSRGLTREQLLASVEVLQGKPELSTVVSAGSFVWQGHFSCTKWPWGPGGGTLDGAGKGTLGPDWVCCFYLSICCIGVFWKPAELESSFFCAAQKIGIRLKRYKRIWKVI